MQVLKQRISNLLTCGIVNDIFIMLLYKLLLILLVAIAWKIFTDTSIQSARTYLFVHHRIDENQDDLFTSDGESGAEENFASNYRSDRTELLNLDVYLTHGIKRVRYKDLQTFAKENKYNLHIKVAKLLNENEHNLPDLMKSPYCSVKAFTEQDYKNLAGHLDVNLEESWKRTSDMEKRDEETEQKLKEVQYCEYDYIQVLFNANIEATNLIFVNLP
ncbi:hypothetical protein EB796_019083 [Bugula neritina]|uniref:Uncharacterized protein n=1 Tax=Bugula neritina TaxID=10212 RepID=A0A7J7JB44_BUGNE|nr:hypothetical protein EB796_019083 [Bugula neritina]